MVSTLYLIVKALHIISIIAWMAGLLYLYRLFVYHVAEKEAVVKTRLQLMETRLYHIITLPAMLASLVFGIVLIALDPSLMLKPWFLAKVVFVIGMIGMTHIGGAQIDKLQAGTSKYSERTFRILNEVPTILLILIVFLVVLKPWN